MSTSSANIASLGGTVVRDKYKPGQKYIRPVFKSAEDLMLSLSSDVQKTAPKALTQTHKLDETKTEIEEKTYVKQSTAAAIDAKQATHLSKRQVIIIVSVLIALAVIGIFSSLLITGKISLNSTQPTSKKLTVVKKQTPTPTSGAAASTSTQSQTATASYTATVPAKSTKPAAKTTTPTTTTTSTQGTAGSSTQAQSQTSKASGTGSLPIASSTTGDPTPPSPTNSSTTGDPTPPTE